MRIVRHLVVIVIGRVQLLQFFDGLLELQSFALAQARPQTIAGQDRLE